MPTTPYASTRLAQFIDQRIGELHHKTQADIATEAGFRNANFITMLKTGSSKVALDRVLMLAKALEVEPALLMHLAIEQSYGTEMLQILVRLLGTPVTDEDRKLPSSAGDGPGGPVSASRAPSDTDVAEVLKHDM